MGRKLIFSAEVSSAPTKLKFFGGEEHLRLVADRHLAAGRLVAEQGSEALLPEAFFHVRMATECLLKHLFCLWRFAHGMRADDLITLKLAKDYGHEAKRLGTLLEVKPELRGSRALNEVVRLLPKGRDWNEGRYGPASEEDTRDKFDDFVHWVALLMKDIDEGVEDV